MKKRYIFATVCLSLTLVTACKEYDSPNFQVTCKTTDQFTCTEKKGLSEGQSFLLTKDIVLDKISGRIETAYFVAGERVTQEDLSSFDGKEACAITLSNSWADKPSLSQNYIKRNQYTIPSLQASYRITDISWYIDTVHFSAIDIKGNGASFVAFCGQVQAGRVKDNFQETAISSTSLDSLMKNLKGYLIQE